MSLIRRFYDYSFNFFDKNLAEIIFLSSSSILFYIWYHLPSEKRENFVKELTEKSIEYENHRKKETMNIERDNEYRQKQLLSSSKQKLESTRAYLQRYIWRYH